VGLAPAYRGINLRKRSVKLCLRSEEGRQAAPDLAGTADGLVESFRPGGLARGQPVDAAMPGSMVDPLPMTGQVPVGSGNRGFSRAPTADAFDCAEGRITVGGQRVGGAASPTAGRARTGRRPRWTPTPPRSYRPTPAETG
jgi:crotonobetainyl-CoA:carnitine CoA-transferase CaiB-like acyl-CoA transferase